MEALLCPSPFQPSDVQREAGVGFDGGREVSIPPKAQNTWWAVMCCFSEWTEQSL